MEAAEMDPSLWGRLPNTLLQRIFSNLPIKSLAKFRIVSKKINMFPLDSAFSGLHATLSPPTFMLIITQMPPKTRRRKDVIRCIDQHGIPHMFQWDFVCLSSFFRRLQLFPRASAGGFLCFFLGEYSSTPNVYYIFNPLTKEWRTFRSVHEILDPAIVGMHFDAQNMSCKLIVGADRLASEDTRKAFMYDTMQATWKEIKPLPNRYIKAATSPVSIRGSLYWLAEEASVWSSGQRWVLGFDMDKEIWTEIIAVSNDFLPVCLGELDGRIAMITVRPRKEGFQLWRLDEEEQRWMWVQDIHIVNAPPGYFCQAFTGVASDGVWWLMENRFGTIVKYDMREKSLHVFMGKNDCRDGGTVCASSLGFEPSFLRLGDLVRFDCGKKTVEIGT
eukprot:Gb_12543 [translate_table: standard]